MLILYYTNLMAAKMFSPLAVMVQLLAAELLATKAGISSGSSLKKYVLNNSATH